jgi:hypothetical protein
MIIGNLCWSESPAHGKLCRAIACPEGEKGTGYLIGILPVSRAVSRIVRMRHSTAPLRSLSPPCAQAPMQLPT